MGRRGQPGAPRRRAPSAGSAEPLAGRDRANVGIGHGGRGALVRRRAHHRPRSPVPRAVPRAGRSPLAARSPRERVERGGNRGRGRGTPALHRRARATRDARGRRPAGCRPHRGRVLVPRAASRGADTALDGAARLRWRAPRAGSALGSRGLGPRRLRAADCVPTRGPPGEHQRRKGDRHDRAVSRPCPCRDRRAPRRRDEARLPPAPGDRHGNQLANDPRRRSRPTGNAPESRSEPQKYAARAAEHATEALAFDRAANLWALALELTPTGDPERRALSEKLGDAFGNVGRGALARRWRTGTLPSAQNAALALDPRRRARRSSSCAAVTSRSGMALHPRGARVGRDVAAVDAVHGGRVAAPLAPLPARARSRVRTARLEPGWREASSHRSTSAGRSRTR